MDRVLRRLGDWMKGVLAVPLRWLDYGVVALVRGLSLPFRWLAARLARPIAWFNHQMRRLWVWFVSLPAEIQNFLVALVRGVINLLAPGWLVPWRQIVRIAKLLGRAASWVADWASKPARLLWRRIRPALVRAWNAAAQGFRRAYGLAQAGARQLGSALAAPFRLAARRLAPPVKAMVRAVSTLSGRLGAWSRRYKQRWLLLRQGVTGRARRVGLARGGPVQDAIEEHPPAETL
jgi:hypothetical protein